MSFVKILEISGLVIGLLYLYLEFKAYKGFWFVGMLMNIIGFTVYYSSGLFGECAHGGQSGVQHSAHPSLGGVVLPAPAHHQTPEAQPPPPVVNQ